MNTTTKMSLVTRVIALFGLALNASAALVNVSPGTIALATHSSDIGFPAANALDRNYAAPLSLQQSRELLK